jgi:hypothetical protein
MEFFINESSFEGQNFDSGSAQNAMQKLVELTDVIIEHIKDKIILKSNLLLYTSIRFQELLVSTLEHFPKELRSIVIKRMYHSTLIVDWNNEMRQDDSIEYFCQTTNKVVTNTSIAEAAERKLLDKSERYLINLNPSSYSTLTQTVVIKRSTVQVTLSLSCISDNAQLKSHFNLERVHFDDFLRNNSEFRKTKFDVQGRPVYKNKISGQLWYLDNLHRDHFEVFSGRLIHIGEATLEGNMIENSRDKDKDNTLVF